MSNNEIQKLTQKYSEEIIEKDMKIRIQYKINFYKYAFNYI